MKAVGIIINPASGKDIRRLIAKGMTVTNQEKINSVVRMILAMDAIGVKTVKIMPDITGMGKRIIRELEGELTHCSVSLLALPYVLGTQDDTIRAAAMMCEQKFACMIVMGGDGTCRVAAKGAGDLPMIPVSTGTNNVFPQVIEGTLVGMAAAFLATKKVTVKQCCYYRPFLQLKKDGELKDIALIDIVTVNAADKASRAVWEPERVLELFLTQAAPDSIGLSSIGGWVDPLSPQDAEGLHITLAESGRKVMAPIAPGLLKTVFIQTHHRFDAANDLPISKTPCAVALDGEREIMIVKGEKWTVGYKEKGVFVVDANKVLLLAGQHFMSA